MLYNLQWVLNFVNNLEVWFYKMFLNQWIIIFDFWKKIKFEWIGKKINIYKQCYLFFSMFLKFVVIYWNLLFSFFEKHSYEH
jgi:hypothetical protein